VLYGIGCQIRNRLQNAMLVPSTLPIRVAIEHDLAIAGDGTQLIDDLLAHDTQVHRTGLDHDSRAFAHPRQIKQITNDISYPGNSPSDNLRLSLYRAIRIRDMRQSERGQLDCIEGIANIVPDYRENPSLEVSREAELFLIVLLLSSLGPAPLVNVYAATYVACKSPALILERRSAIEYPAIRPVVASEAIIHLEWLTPVEMVKIIGNATVQVFWMDAFGPAITQFLLERASSE